MKTPWFVDGQVPAREGVYEVQPSDWSDWKEAFQYWDGEWHFRRHTIEEAFAVRKHSSVYDDPNWRGLAKKP